MGSFNFLFPNCGKTWFYIGENHYPTMGQSHAWQILDKSTDAINYIKNYNWICQKNKKFHPNYSNRNCWNMCNDLWKKLGKTRKKEHVNLTWFDKLLMSTANSILIVSWNYRHSALLRYLPIFFHMSFAKISATYYNRN